MSNIHESHSTGQPDAKTSLLSSGPMGNPFEHAKVLLEAGYRQEGIKALQRAREAFHSQGNCRMEAETFYWEGETHQDSGRPTLAEACFRQSFHLFHREGAQREALKALSGMASSQQQEGRLNLALRTYRWVLQFSSRDSMIEIRFWALCSMSFLLLRLDQEAEAKTRLGEAMPLVAAICPGISPTLHHLMANIEFFLGHMEAAEQELRQAAKEASGLGFPRIEGRMLAELAQLYTRFGRTWEARELLQEALFLVQQDGDEADRAKIRDQMKTLAPRPTPFQKWPHIRLDRIRPA